MPFDLEIKLDRIEDKIILRLRGRLDAVTSVELEKRANNLIEEGHFHLLFDFAKIDYLSSSGLRLLLSLTKKLKAKKGSLVLFSINEEIMEIIKIAGFERILTIARLEEEALRC